MKLLCIVKRIMAISTSVTRIFPLEWDINTDVVFHFNVLYELILKVLESSQKECVFAHLEGEIAKFKANICTSMLVNQASLANAKTVFYSKFNVEWLKPRTTFRCPYQHISPNCIFQICYQNGNSMLSFL